MWKTCLALNEEMTNKKRVDFFPHNYFTKFLSVSQHEFLLCSLKDALPMSSVRLIFSLPLLRLHVISIK